jgi:Zn finger protein HypA/HybF involved in hydrogenase expression
MTTIASVRQSCKCESCGQWLMAPERSTYVNEEQITHLWVCPNCGNEFETSIFSGPDVPLTPEIVDEFLPNLMVA